VSGKNIPNIFDCNLKKDYQILIIFDTNIFDTTGDQTTVQFSTAPIVCFCTTWENKTNKILHFLSYFTCKGFPRKCRSRHLVRWELECRDGIELENVEKFTYLGSNMTYDLDCSKEIAVRITKALDKIWKSKAITLETKLSILKTCVQYNAVQL